MSTKTDEPTTTDHGSRGHHPYSPSTLQAREASPCFKPRGGTSEAAELGTRQHEAVESRVDDPLLSDEAIAAVARALSMVDNLKALIAPLPFEELVEQYLPLDSEIIEAPDGTKWEGTTAGFPDRVIVWRPTGYEENERHAALFDWKFGRYGVPPAEENRQGHAYMLGLQTRLAKQGLQLKSCQVTFFSPHRDEEPTSHTFRDGFESLGAELVTIVRRSEAIDKAIESRGFAGLTPDERKLVITSTKCRFCARLGLCPAMVELGMPIAKALKPLKVPDDVHGFNERDPKVLARDLVVADILKAWAEERRRRIVGLAIDHPEDDRYIPEGYALSAAYPREVTNPANLLTFLRKEFGWKVVEENITIPLTKFEKRLSEAAPRGEKTAAVENFQQRLEAAGLTQVAAKPVVSLRMR